MRTKAKSLFSEWVNQLSVAQYKVIRKRVVDECKISSSCFSQWKNANTYPSPLAQDVINRIAVEETGKPVFDN